MKTIHYTVKQSAANFGDMDGFDVEASLKKFCDEFELYLNKYCADLAPGYEAKFTVVPVSDESNEGVVTHGPTDECWTEHTETMDFISHYINHVYSDHNWEVAE